MAAFPLLPSAASPPTYRELICSRSSAVFEPCRRQGQGVADGRAILIFSGDQLNVFNEAVQGAMAQSQRAYGVGIAGESHHADEIGRPSLELFAVSQDEFLERLS